MVVDGNSLEKTMPSEVQFIIQTGEKRMMDEETSQLNISYVSEQENF